MKLNDQTSPAAEETQHESPNLEQLESIIAKGIPNVEAVALALLEIHERKLFRRQCGSFKAYLHQRWQLSRARGYQLLHFARLKRMSTAVDTTSGPKNERQARQLDAAGRIRQQEKDDPIMQAMEYVTAVFERLPQCEQRELIYYLRDLLTELERKLERQAGRPARA